MSVTRERPIENATAIAAVKMLLGSTTPPKLAMQGASMQPLLAEPMILELESIEKGLHVGDIVVFEKDSKLVAHRVTSLQQERIQTCGDARPWSPEYPERQAIVGKVKAVYASDRAAARRLDTTLFRIRGEFYARTRAARAVGHWPMAIARRLVNAFPWRRQRTYPALVEVMAAITQGDRTRFERALSKVDPEALVATARRHGCSAALVEGVCAFTTATEQADYLRRALQPSGRSIVLNTLVLRRQVISIVATLKDRGIPFALLKGAARVYRDEPNAALHGSSDIDILVPQRSLDAAIAALRAQGYDDSRYAKVRDRYRRHHHAAPLLPTHGGFAIEVHTALDRMDRLSTPLDWDALQPHMAMITGPSGAALGLDNFGNALHLVVHSRAQLRLRDSVLLAHLMTHIGEEGLAALNRIAREELKDSIRLSASLAMAADIAGVAWPRSPDVEEYLGWTTRREDIPLLLAKRAPLVESWYAGGRRFRFTPLVWQLLDPNGFDHNLQMRSVPQVVARSITSVIAYAYARLMRN